MAETRCDILIVGGGPAGAGLALVASSLGFAVVLVDAREGYSDSSDAGRAIALTGESRERLMQLGLWQHLSPAVHALDRVRVQNLVTGHEHLYQAQDLGLAALFYSVGYDALRQALATALAGTAGVNHLYNRRLVTLHLEAGWRRARLSDDSVIRARLVVAADGRDSSVRHAVGLGARTTDYPQAALIFALEGQAFEPTTVVERLGNDGAIALLPLQGDRVAVAWIDGINTTQRRRLLPHRDLLAELAQRSGVADIGRMRVVTPVVAQQLSLTHADRYVAPRLVLIGDAAHGAHPVHAQGFNLAVADLQELATLWRNDARRFAAAEVLALYQRNRRLASAARLGLTDVVNRLFDEASAPWAFLHGVPGAGIGRDGRLAAATIQAREALGRD